MLKRSFHRSTSQSGQVLAAGVFILVILLLLVFAGFDIHNALRARFKIQTAQESAAIAGATWQKNSLNLIGEINLIKACSVLMEGDNANWNTTIPRRDTLLFRRNAAIQARVDILTEMQTRISFVGPLIGFAAAQQAAKANGVPNRGDLDFYLEDLQNNIRYRMAKATINRYEWRPPYMELIRTISQNGIAVYPNTTAGTSPRVDPPELADPSFYQAISRKRTEIAEAKGEAIYPQTSWDALRNFVYRDTWKDRFASPPWWDIDFNASAFPNESEIFTLGVSQANRYPTPGEPAYETFRTVASNHLENSHADSLYGMTTPLPTSGELKLNMFCYEQNTWDPEYLMNARSDYSALHSYWFKGTAMRKPVKSRYTYEGPAAYVETHIDMDKTSGLIRLSGQKTYGDGSIRIGSKREDQSINLSTSYRPGAIAKALGSLNENDPPTALPLVLPVFEKVIIMPTYMPIPYNFSVLRDYYSTLRRFLAWLSTRENLDSTDGLPSACYQYYDALLTLIKDKEFRYYGWNPNFDSAAFDDEWHENLISWHSERQKDPSKYQYNTNSGPNLPGYYQEPNIFTACPKTTKRSGVVTVPTFKLSGERTGTATRHFIDSDGHYMVVTSSNHIITRAESDPTFDPNCCTTNYNPPSGGGSGPGNYVDGSGATTLPWPGL